MGKRAWPVIFAAGFLLAGLPAAAQQPGYYVEEDGIVTWLENADPHTIRPAEWQGRVYPPGPEAGGTKYWAGVSGKRSEDVPSPLPEDPKLQLRHPPQPRGR